VEKATLCEFYENMDFSLPPVTPIWVTLSDFFAHFTLKIIQRMALKKNA
jgi:hypothetical protein